MEKQLIEVIDLWGRGRNRRLGAFTWIGWQASAEYTMRHNEQQLIAPFNRLKLTQQMIYDVVIMMLARQCQMRTIIDLPDEQISALANLCQQTRFSRAELIRRAVAEYLLQHHPEDDDLAFGIWKQRMENGLDYQNRLRKEWDE